MRRDNSKDQAAADIQKMAARQTLCCGLVRCNLRKYTIRTQIMVGILSVSFFLLAGLCAVCIGNIVALGTKTEAEAVHGLSTQIYTNAQNFSEANAQEVARTFARRAAAAKAMAIAVSNFYHLTNLPFGNDLASLWHEHTNAAVAGATRVGAGGAGVVDRYQTKSQSSFYLPKTTLHGSGSGCYIPNNKDPAPNLGTNMNSPGCDSLAARMGVAATKKEVDRSVLLDPYFIKYAAEMTDIDQIYVGFESSGLFRQYPGNNANVDKASPEENTYDPRKRPWYDDAKSAFTEIVQGRKYGRTVISAPYKGYSLGIWMVTVAKAIYNENGNLLAVIGVDISIKNMQEKMLNVHFLESGFVALVETEKRCSGSPDSSSCSRLVVAYPKFETYVRDGEVSLNSIGLERRMGPANALKYNALFGTQGGVVNFTDTESNTHYLVAHAMAKSPMYVQRYNILIVIPSDEALVAVPKMKANIAATEAEVSVSVALVTLATAIGVGGIVFKVTNTISKPVSSMVKISNSIVKGAAEQDFTKDFKKQDKHMKRIQAYAKMSQADRGDAPSNNEMVQLARSFLTMTSGLKRDANRSKQQVIQPMNSYHTSQENDFVSQFAEQRLG